MKKQAKAANKSNKNFIQYDPNEMQCMPVDSYLNLQCPFKTAIFSIPNYITALLGSVHKFKLHLFQIWKDRCEKIIIWESGKKSPTAISITIDGSSNIRVYDDIEISMVREKRVTLSTQQFYGEILEDYDAATLSALINQLPLKHISSIVSPIQM
ncbi:hypothetical protein Glove_395g21 [Diversispora epigaea]|uniref:Uncharacterized protein n=1 Tax=Diversispora epigaea TaxID=1348612 RepID=A0A397H9B0_9GLOM|nr:hypothetical protein Glove_395g21 [Diversispora epigaea]